MTPRVLSDGRRLTRRTFLRGAGVAVSLPWLTAMTRSATASESLAKPRRMVAICTDMGLMPELFFPKGAGKDYLSSPYLDLLKDYRKDFTVFSGLSHPQVDGGHAADLCFLTGAPHPGVGGFRNSISLDQFAAQRIGSATRFPHLNLIIGHETKQNLSWTAAGVGIPPEQWPSRVFKKLFLQGSADELKARLRELKEGRSILDAVADSAKGLERRVGPEDRQRLDQYFTAVRDLEQQLQRAEEWEHKPKPEVKVKPPADIADNNDTPGKSKLMYDLARLALETDSTRLVTIMAQDQHSTHKIQAADSHHALTHHGNRPEVIATLRKMEENQLKAFGDFLGSLRGTAEAGETLLDRTMVLQGAGMGNANSHSNVNLPILMAGGGFKHGQHLVFDKDHNHPLATLYVSMLQRMGVEASRFASGTTTLRGLEMA